MTKEKVVMILGDELTKKYREFEKFGEMTKTNAKNVVGIQDPLHATKSHQS